MLGKSTPEDTCKYPPGIGSPGNYLLSRDLQPRIAAITIAPEQDHELKGCQEEKRDKH